MPKIELIHGDCMKYMAKMPDKAFDLAIVDPPYGGGATPQSEEGLIDTKNLRGGQTISGSRRTGQDLGVSLTSTKLKERAEDTQKNTDQKLSIGI